MKIALAFDDVLLVPQYSDILSRKDPDVSTRISQHLVLKIPVISSCMDTVTGPAMAITMWKLGGLGMLHRYNTIQQQVDMYLEVKKNGADCAVAVGATNDFVERAQALVDNGVSILCIDIAHGDSLVSVNAVEKIRVMFPNITLIAGNVATGSGCARLIDAGADAIRVGIGGGGACTSRIKAAAGKPTLQTIFDCKEYLDKYGYKDYCIIADGGIRESGDCVKSIAAGASCVMLGQLLAATDESPGNIIETPTGKYKSYRGMASRSAQVDWNPEKSKTIVPEGEEMMLPYKGNVEDILYLFVGGLRTGMTYSNARTLKELQNNAEFIQITSAGWAESKPHAKK